jgi:hypothetical protein
MVETTARHGLPLLAAAQAHKEIAHNEALIRLAALSHIVVEGGPTNAPPASPQPGQSWLVGSAPTGAWAQQEARIATWDEGGWRFIDPVPGMLAWDRLAGRHYLHRAGDWSDAAWPAQAIEVQGKIVVSARQPAITDPTGGASIDNQARAAIAAILAALRAHGLIEAA